VKSLLRWAPLLVVGALFVSASLCLLLRPRDPPPPDFPPPLVPPGTTRTALRSGDEHCYAHRVATFAGAMRPATETWARSLDLPCADDTTPCAHWSTERRTSPFWNDRFPEPQGLDTVDVTFDGGTVTVDWGDYLCSGPN